MSRRKTSRSITDEQIQILLAEADEIKYAINYGLFDRQDTSPLPHAIMYSWTSPNGTHELYLYGTTKLETRWHFESEFYKDGAYFYGGHGNTPEEAVEDAITNAINAGDRYAY